jgi:hypothetical protein
MGQDDTRPAQLIEGSLMTEEPTSVVSAFGDACNAHDLEAALSYCADDVMFDGTTPPDGLQVVGHDDLREIWAPIFADPTTHVEVEDTFSSGDRVVQRCRYSWRDGHVRAVDLYRVVDGKITEKLSYVKG